MKSKVIIGSRGSDLALWQANFVLNELKKIKIRAEIKIIKTQGDIVQNLSWDKMEGKGFFTKEIEDALLKNEIDLAVHSHKDLPTDPVKGLAIAAVSQREDPSELLLINKNAVDEKLKFSLKQGALVGTSSARRKSQMLAWRPDVQLQDLRGNVPTRVQKLRDKKYDAILVAFAGIERLKLDLSEFHSEKLDPKEFIPAPAQGVLALQVRANDKALFRKLQKLNAKKVAETIAIERKVLNLFQGGCQLPLGVYCEGPAATGAFRAWVAKADEWDSVPRYFYFESKTSKGFAESMVRRISAPFSFDNRSGKAKVARAALRQGMRSAVFISRDEKPNDFFKHVLEAHGYKVFFQSLIEVKQVPQEKFPKTDWVFFSSKNAVKYGPPVAKKAKVGVMGKATAEEARKLGWKIDFVSNSNDTGEIAKRFAAVAGNKTVLFPRAKDSLQTVQQQLKKGQVKNVVVYETIKAPDSRLQTPDADILIFTSPSNVEAFFENRNRSPFLRRGAGGEVQVIAMGDATAKALKKYRVKVNAMPPSYDDLGLVQAVFGL